MVDDAHHFFITICAASVSGGMEINMNNVPIPLTLEEIVIQGGIEGSENAYEDEHGLDYSGPDSAFLYYDGKPFTGLYYELFFNGNLELYIKYQNGLPTEDCFEFYENGKIKTYSYYSKDRLNSYSFSYDEQGKIKLSSVWENGKFIQKIYDKD